MGGDGGSQGQRVGGGLQSVHVFGQRSIWPASSYVVQVGSCSSNQWQEMGVPSTAMDQLSSSMHMPSGQDGSHADQEPSPSDELTQPGFCTMHHASTSCACTPKHSGLVEQPR